MPVTLPLLKDFSRAAAPPAPSPRAHADRLVDSHGRTIRDLRLSITDRCNFRCVYCMEPDTRFLPADQLLTIDEIVRIASICVGLGVDKLRITGGEPTVHPGLTRIIGRLAALPARDLAMTTNGSTADPAALRAWRSAGLQRITISIDAATDEAFARLTRSRVPLATVLGAIRGAVDAGLGPVRLNAVIIRGWNEDQVVPLATLARDLRVEMRFIEFMPLDAGHAWGADRVVTARQIIDRIAGRYPLVDLGRASPSSTSLQYAFADMPDGPARIGLIAPVSQPFCGACSRLRITADGKVRPCLFSRDEWDLVPLLRDGRSTDRQIAEFLQDATWTKQAGHGILADGFRQPDRPMSAIGG